MNDRQRPRTFVFLDIIQITAAGASYASGGTASRALLIIPCAITIGVNEMGRGNGGAEALKAR